MLSLDFEQSLTQLIQLLDQPDKHHQIVLDFIQKIHPSDLFYAVQSLPPKYRFLLFQHLDDVQSSQVLSEVNDEVQVELIAQMSDKQLINSSKHLALDDLADIIPKLPQSVMHNVLLTMDVQRREHLAQVLSYPEDSAGGLMNTDIISIRADVSVDTVLRYLRLLKKMPVGTDQIFVVDENYKLIGSLYLATLVTQKPKTNIKPLISPNYAIKAKTSELEVADMFAARDLISAPVVDENNQLIGRITIDDVVDVIKTQAEHSVMSMAGLDEEDDLFAPIFESVTRRIVWLFINLITAFIAIFVISLFEATLEEKIALAILMPLVASMGGIAGTQTLILFTRGLATNKISQANIKWLFNKELGIGVINGLIWSLFICIITYIWFSDVKLSLVIATAIIINLITAAGSGAILPVILTRLKIDPALAGGVVLTTITDVIGFIAFLGLASIIM